jgi:hypothetical protein
MNIETLKELTGWKRPTINPTPTDLEIALARVNADHKSVLVAVKLLTEAVQSNAAAHLNMTVVHEERHAYVIKALRELKKEVSAAESRHLTAFELALRPVLRAIDLVVEKVNNVEMELFANRSMIDVMRKELLADREAVLVIQGTKLNAIAERLDDLVKIVAQSMIKHPEGVTPAPTPTPRGGKRSNSGRKPGSKPRPLDVQYADVSNRLQRCRPDSKARLKYLFRLTELRHKLGMASIRKEG